MNDELRESEVRIALTFDLAEMDQAQLEDLRDAIERELEVRERA